VLEFAQCFGFNLANALARHVELLADFFKRVIAGHFDTKTHTQHLGLSRCKAVQNVLDHIAKASLHGGLHWCSVGGILDEVAQMAVVIVPDRCFHGDRLLGDFHDLANFVFRDLHALCQYAGIRLKAKLLQVLAADAVHLVDGFDHVHRNANGARLVGYRAGNGLANPPSCIRREFVATAVFELVHRLHQADVAFLDQVQELQATVGVFLGDRNHQAQVGFDHFFLGVARRRLALVHALVDVLEVGQRNHHAALQVDEGLLQLLDGRDVALDDHAPRLTRGGLFFHPLQIE